MFVVLPLQMVLRNKNRVNYKSSRKVRFRTRFVATSFFLFIFIHFAALVNFNSQHNSVYGRLGFQTHDDQAYTSYKPFHNPSPSDRSEPNAEYLEYLSETEVEEKPVLDEDNSLQSSLSLNKIGSLDISKNLRLQFLRSCQNRPTLSLFILHHSWKSFLS
jgi:hypothetical protein